MTVKSIQERFGVEIKVLRRLGMRWAVLTSLSHILHKKADLPKSVDRELRLTKNMIESGCFSACDVDCALNAIESVLISKASSLGEEKFSKWVDLIGKAMRGLLTPQEVLNLPFIKPLIHNCNFLKCTCGKVEMSAL